MALQAVFENFKRNKSALQQIHRETLECFEKIEESLSSKAHGRELANQLVKEITMSQSPPSDAILNLEESMVIISVEGHDTPSTSLAETLYTKEEREEVCKLFTQSRPSLIVVGQTNSGKSSIINEILGCKVVSTSDQPCTSRIVKMTYSEENYVRLVTQDGNVMESIKPKGTKVPRDLIELKQGDRENPERVTAVVEAGFDISFLNSGVDIIDSPGRNENKVLDDLVRKQLDNILPFIVYVIDGHNLFTALVSRIYL
jgi:ribosome biogenesis GTPase A